MADLRFHFERDEDASGVSGTGYVATGIMFEDGSVALRWRGPLKSTAIYDSIHHVIAIHGHEGRTLVVFDDA